LQDYSAIIWYHLALAHYLQGDFNNAADSYRKCYNIISKDDHESLAAISNWLHNTLRRLDKDEDAEKILEFIDENMNIVENASYHQALLLYKGILQESDIFDESNAEPLELVTKGYSIGNWRLVNSDRDGAIRLFNNIITTDAWAGFG